MWPKAGVVWWMLFQLLRRSPLFVLCCVTFLTYGCLASSFPTASPGPATEAAAWPTAVPSSPPAEKAPAVDVLDPWVSDLHELAGVLKEDRAVPPDFEDAVAALETELPMLSPPEVLTAFMRLVKLAGGGQLLPDWQEAGYGLDSTYPFRVTWFDDGLYVTEALSGYARLLDQRLVAIGDFDIESAIEEVAALIPYSRTEALYAEAPRYLSNPGILNGLNLLPQLEVGDFTFEDTEQALVVERLTAAAPDADPWVSFAGDPFPTPLPRAESYWFVTLPADRAVYVQYNRCESQAGLPFEAFVVDLLYESEASGAQRMVVDLRRNPGGQRALNELLVAAVHAYATRDPSHRVYVIVSPVTLGAALEAARALREQTGAIIVGTPELERADGFVRTELITLSHSRLRLLTTTRERPFGAALEADLLFLPDAPALRAGGDPVLTALLTSPTVAEIIVEPPQGPGPDVRLPTDLAPRSSQWREDLGEMVQTLRTLPEIHEGGFGIVNEQPFKDAVVALDSSISMLEDHKVAVGMMQILALLGDAHTRLDTQAWEQFQAFAFPLELQWFDDGLFVTAVQPGYDELLALELVEIGGVPIPQVVDKLGGVISHENGYGLRAAGVEFLVRPLFLHALGLATDVRAGTFGFQDPEGGRITRHLVSQAADDMQDAWVPAVPPGAQPLYLQRSTETYYWYTYLAGTRTLYFQYNLCAEREESPFAAFLDSMFASARHHDVGRLVIDLRRNPGGFREPVHLLLAQLQQHSGSVPQHKLLVLIGNRTFSSAVYLTSLLQRQAGATLIGQPTAQGPNFYAGPMRLVLPNSGLEIGYSRVYFRSAEVSLEAIVPHVGVPLTSADYFAGRDSALNAALSR